MKSPAESIGAMSTSCPDPTCPPQRCVLPPGVALLAGLVVALAFSAGSTACQTPPRVVQPGAPGDETRVIEPGALDDFELPEYTEADVAFMQGMIPHHAQALDMTALLWDRTNSDDMRLLARRIEISQKDEIAMMGRWLEERGEALPSDMDYAGMDGMLMPGMLTSGQMEQLAAARGSEFDRLFLEFMISHHDGALQMVGELFGSPGAGQVSAIFHFASEVDADQAMEITRMRGMLARP